MDYKQIFDDWEQMGIIDETNQDEADGNGLYLAHPAVIKESSYTTKIRPVFDVSENDKNSNFSNDSPGKDPNMIELIIPHSSNFEIRKMI
ncbi:hypothetical protein [Rickettsia endosymbiont of Orchestes rusci]|uniref:hypothetical protein n=1 Tax=Rickettsia endosymbiont of Orchestes rusci TaxID=3066250 RepID=UPI00313C81F4